MITIGCHISIEGGYRAMGERILSVGGDTFQFFTKNPQGRSKTKEADPADVKALRDMLEARGMPMPLAHAPYTYNPCSQREEVREYSVTSMRSELEFLEALPGSMYNFHPGCHVNQGVEVGIGFIASLLDRVLFEGMHSRVLLETMAGKGTEIGRSFDELAEIIDKTDSALRDNIGVCLDTCHINDAGYDISDMDSVLDEFDRIIGLDRLCAVHLNDSMNPRGSHKDRHAKLGEGTLGIANIRSIVTNPILKKLPFYLETPNELDGYAEEIKLVRQMAE